MKDKYATLRHQVSFKFKMVFFHFIMIFSIQIIYSQASLVSPVLLPGAKVYDVTKPSTYGGTLKATPNDPSDDDAPAINAALVVAYNNAQTNENKASEVFQQFIYFPKGEYHLKTPIIMPPPTRGKPKGIWLFGEGIDKTKFILKNASEIGLFGSASQPNAVIQIADYTYSNKSSGNTNFQLYGTDFSVIIPADQPNAVGVSYGSANMGGLRNVHIKAEGTAGHTGLALIQYNNGPGYIENVTVEGFNTGIEVSDGWGETFTFSKIKLLNQNKGGIGFIVDDKMLGIDGLISEQKNADVKPFVIFDKNPDNSEHGGFPHLTLLNSTFKSESNSSVPIIDIASGHLFIRNISTSGYGDGLIKDHGIIRNFSNAQITDEYISVHGKTKDEEKKVVNAYEGAPEKSINLPIPTTPEIAKEVWDKLAAGIYTIVSQTDLVGGVLNINTEWVIVDPTKAGDDTDLFQAALNSGARYVGILNHKSMLISRNIVINANMGKVELIYGYLADILIAPALHERKNATTPTNYTLFTIETGSSETLTIKGLRFITGSGDNSDVNLFQNNAAQTLIFEDVRCKHTPRAYRNGPKSYGQKIYFENVEFAYNGLWYDVIMRFDQQKVIARQFNLEAPILVSSKTFQGVSYKTYTILPRLYNNGSEIVVISQKMGELNGVFAETVNGGKTELLSTFFNVARTEHNKDEQNLTNFTVSGINSDFCLVGQERIRANNEYIDSNGDYLIPLPNKNKFGMYTSKGVQHIIEATSLPTYLKYAGFNPFNDTDYLISDKKNHYRVTGLLRVITDSSLGLQTNIEHQNVKVYSKDDLLSIISPETMSEIKIYDASGKLVIRKQCNFQTFVHISTSSLSSGLIIISVTAGNGVTENIKHIVK